MQTKTALDISRPDAMGLLAHLRSAVRAHQDEEIFCLCDRLRYWALRTHARAAMAVADDIEINCRIGDYEDCRALIDVALSSVRNMTPCP